MVFDSKFNSRIDRFRDIDFTKKKLVTLLVIVLLLLSLPILVFVSTLSEKQQTNSQASEQTIDTLNTKVLENNEKGAKSENQFLLEQRKEKMLELALANPQEFLNKTMSDDLRNSFPEDQRSLIEEEKEVSGHLVVSIVDNFKEDSFQKNYFVQNSQGMFPLKLTDAINADLSHGGKNITLKGFMLDNLIITSNSSINISDEISAASLLGEIKYLVIPVNFIDDRSMPFSIDEISDKLFGDSDSLKKYYLDNSKEQLIITGKVLDWQQMDIRKGKVCKNADSLIEFAYKNFQDLISDYFGVIFVFPNLKNCFWAGMATMDGEPRFVWPNNFDLPTLTHEIGHNLGINHASLAICKEPNCGKSEYGDLSDTMGINYAGFNGVHLTLLGFIPESIISTFFSDGLLSVYKLGGSLKPQIIKVDDRETEKDIYIEYRGTKNNYNKDVPYPLGEGVVIYRWDGKKDSNTLLIDVTKGDGNKKNIVLRDGNKIKIGGVTIRQIFHNSSFARIEIYKNY